MKIFFLYNSYTLCYYFYCPFCCHFIENIIEKDHNYGIWCPNCKDIYMCINNIENGFHDTNFEKINEKSCLKKSTKTALFIDFFNKLNEYNRNIEMKITMKEFLHFLDDFYETTTIYETNLLEFEKNKKRKKLFI